MKKNYRHLFFDLDHTLWDFATNSRAALHELFHEYGLADRGLTDFDTFYSTYVTVNDRYWSLYRAGKMGKKTLRKIRFSTTLQRFGIEDEYLGEKFSQGYIDRSPYQTALFPDCHDTLSYLKDKGYVMHVITNGFEEVQHIKLRESGLEQYFIEIITSEGVQARKPDPRIFAHAFERTGAAPSESLMIGDNLEADVAGALRSGMDAVYFNPEGVPHQDQVTLEIKGLKELVEVL